MSEPRRNIFITGGASGIGRAVARHFAARGWFVSIADVNVQGMADTLGLIEGGFKYSHKLDVRDRDTWDVALQSAATAGGGRIDAMINNAGIGTGGPLAELAEKRGSFIRLLYRPGHYIVAGSTLAYCGTAIEESDYEKVRAAFVLGPKRSAAQDIEFAVTALVEIALRALSPGINDPRTAIACIDWLTAAAARAMLTLPRKARSWMKASRNSFASTPPIPPMQSGPRRGSIAPSRRSSRRSRPKKAG